MLRGLTDTELTAALEHVSPQAIAPKATGPTRLSAAQQLVSDGLTSDKDAVLFLLHLAFQKSRKKASSIRAKLTQIDAEVAQVLTKTPQTTPSNYATALGHLRTYEAETGVDARARRAGLAAKAMVSGAQKGGAIYGSRLFTPPAEAMTSLNALVSGTETEWLELLASAQQLLLAIPEYQTGVLHRLVQQGQAARSVDVLAQATGTQVSEPRKSTVRVLAAAGLLQQVSKIRDPLKTKGEISVSALGTGTRAALEGNTGPFALTSSNRVLTLAVDGEDPWTWNLPIMVRGALISANFSVATIDATNHTLEFVINGGAPQVVTLTHGTNSQAFYAAEIAAGLVGVTVTNIVGTGIEVCTNTYGTAGSVKCTSDSTAAAPLGFAVNVLMTGTNINTSDIRSSARVDLPESDAIEVVGTNDTNIFFLSSTKGSGSSLVASGNGADVLGITGSAYGTTTGIRFSGDLDTPLRAGDVFYLSGRREVCRVVGDQITLTSTAPANISGEVEVFSSGADLYPAFERALGAWIKLPTRLRLDTALKGLRGAVQGIALGFGKGLVLTQTAKIRSVLDDFLALEYSATPVPVVPSLLRMLQEQRFDRAADLLAGGHLAQFAVLTETDAGHKENVLRSIAVAASTLPAGATPQRMGITGDPDLELENPERSPLVGVYGPEDDEDGPIDVY